MGAEKLEELLQQISTLKEDELAQVVSLVDRLKEERRLQYLKAIEEGLGKYKGQLSTVDEFMAYKQAERKAEKEKENQ